jgi:hypothetical protein
MDTKKMKSLFSAKIPRRSSLVRNKSTRISRIFEKLFVSIVAKAMNGVDTGCGEKDRYISCDSQAVRLEVNINAKYKPWDKRGS